MTTTDNPLDPRFWSDEEKELWKLLAPLIIKIMMNGAEAGVAALPAEVQILMQWDTFSNAVTEYLKGYRITWIRGISDTTAKQIVKLIEAWVQAGEPLSVLEARLAGLEEIDTRRAGQIAATEVTRLYADANQMAWKASGLVGENRWMTARDDKVCPWCGPLDGMVVPLGENGFTTVEGDIGVTGPPLHVGCRCWLQPVVSLDKLEDELEKILNAPS